jgi:hypothetical protein
VVAAAVAPAFAYAEVAAVASASAPAVASASEAAEQAAGAVDRLEAVGMLVHTAAADKILVAVQLVAVLAAAVAGHTP